MRHFIKRNTVLPGRRRKELPDDEEVMVRCESCRKEFKTTVSQLRVYVPHRLLCKECAKRKRPE